MQYRPPRTTTRPKIDGTLSGFVDAEGSGKYAELDDQGRYKVQVPFDLTDKSAQRASAWLRFATPYAGSSDEGMHFPLRKGSEVLLSFEGGDPNRPIIIGAVANSEHANVVTNRNATYNMLQTGRQSAADGGPGGQPTHPAQDPDRQHLHRHGYH